MSIPSMPPSVAAKPMRPSLEAIRGWLTRLEQALAHNERSAMYDLLRDAVPQYAA